MIIALCGLKGSGKTTLAKILSGEIKSNLKIPFFYTRQPLAKPLYLIIETLMRYQGVSEGDIRFYLHEGREKPNHYLNDVTTRHALQTLGTEWGREFINPHLWTDIWQRKYINNNCGPTIVDDLRFLNEDLMFKKLRTKRIRIERPGVELDPSHISELEQLRIKPDFTIVNDGEPNDMWHQLVNFLGVSLYGSY